MHHMRQNDNGIQPCVWTILLILRPNPADHKILAFEFLLQQFYVFLIRNKKFERVCRVV